MKKFFIPILLIIPLTCFSQSNGRINTIITGSSRNDISKQLAADSTSGGRSLLTKTTNSGSSAGTSSAQGETEQLFHGTEPSATITESFEGLGYGFAGPQGEARYRNPSDNSLAVGPDHIVQTVNSRMAIFTKRGTRYSASGIPLYGPVETRNVFRGFGGPCEEINNGDAVVRYDQLAGRWLIVMPIFRRLPAREFEPEAGRDGEPARASTPGKTGQPGEAAKLYIPGKPTPKEVAQADSLRRSVSGRAPQGDGSYCMCYAISTGDDPFGPYYRYEFIRPLFPDYPRPAIWPDGYYIPTSTGDHLIQKHACVAEREKMLEGKPAMELCFIIDGVNFLNNADLDGFQLPPDGDANIMIATGGAQLNNIFSDDGIYTWRIKPDWENPANSLLEGPVKVEVAPYHYQGDGQLKAHVPQPGTSQKLDTQGDKIMSRVVYRRRDSIESIVAVHSVRTEAGNGGIRWYEFRLNSDRNLTLFQQGTYAPDSLYRWLPSPAIDKFGNIGIGYSTGGEALYPGQRFAGRLPGDQPGVLTLREAVLAEGEASQTGTLRWEDYTQTAIDPSDDCTIWYVGDFLKKGADTYSTMIGAFRIGSCNENKDKVR